MHHRYSYDEILSEKRIIWYGTIARLEFVEEHREEMRDPRDFPHRLLLTEESASGVST
jgi:hypothetical protein